MSLYVVIDFALNLLNTLFFLCSSGSTMLFSNKSCKRLSFCVLVMGKIMEKVYNSTFVPVCSCV